MLLLTLYFFAYMYNGIIISTLLEERKITKKEFLTAMEWSSFSQYRQLVTGNPTARVLERVADILQVPIDTFFTRNSSISPSIVGNGNTFNNSNSVVITNQLQHAQIDALEKLIEEKDKRILLLEKLLATIENRQDIDQTESM